MKRQSQSRNPLLEQLIYRIRDPKTARPEFRDALEKIGEYLGFEIAKELDCAEQSILTSMEKEAKHKILTEQPVLIGILRAGVPLYNGLQKAFPESEAGFIGAMRDEKTLKSKISYVAIPNITGKKVILADTMIATGGSIIDTIELLKQRQPLEILVAGVIASQRGIERITQYDSKIKIYAAAIDPELNKKGYIVPGLGDAGDRSYGEKV